jgi:hypothetical protein
MELPTDLPQLADLTGGGGWTRTNDLRIMSQFPDSENKENPANSSADCGKVLQNPHPTRTKKGGLTHD